jgi:catechol 2,3-dioxygenase-like lactoylglutathione lyase family enzyme
MLGSSPVIAVVAVKDLARAKEFYGGTLGLESDPETEEPGGILYRNGGGTKLLVYTSGYAGGSQATAASWEVDDIESEVAALRGKGVVFEQYDNIPGVERDGDLHRLPNLVAAWFKDPEGNILNLVKRA